MKKKEIRVLKIAPNKAPEVVTLENNLHSLQVAVSEGAPTVGLIEFVELDDALILCNEEGKINGLPANRRLNNDIICGTFYILCDSHDGNLTSLPQNLIDYYTEFFSEIEEFTAEDVERATIFKFFPY